MASVWIPAQCRDLTGGAETVRVSGPTVRQALESLELAHPGIRSRLCDGDVLRPGLQVVVDGRIARLGLRQPVTDDSEIHFLPALGGG